MLVPENERKNLAEISLDELLAEQDKQLFLATIEAVSNQEGKVKITPWIPGRGCGCNFSLIVEKRSIGKIRLTGRQHFCCGKMLSVVEFTFKDDSVLSATDVFADLMRRALAVPVIPRRPAIGAPERQRRPFV